MSNLSPVSYKAAIRPKRLGIAGSSSIDSRTAFFCEELGSQLAKQESLILVSGGCKKRIGSPNFSVDWHVIDGAIHALDVDQKRELIGSRIETLLPKEINPKIEKFSAGNTIQLNVLTPQARRFRLITSVDVLLAIAGGNGTLQNLDLGFALERPVLALPMFGEKSATFWENYRPLIQKSFSISDKVANSWEEPISDDTDLKALAKEVCEHLLKGFKSTCMIIMPFKNYDILYEQAIVPALEQADFRPIRTDRLSMTGNIVDTIHQGILNCDCAVAVLNELRPNVMYELGMAHAHQKPVVMLTEGQTPALPFDISNHAVITYTEITGQLTEQIRRSLLEVRKRFVPR